MSGVSPAATESSTRRCSSTRSRRPRRPARSRGVAAADGGGRRRSASRSQGQAWQARSRDAAARVRSGRSRRTRAEPRGECSPGPPCGAASVRGHARGGRPCGWDFFAWPLAFPLPWPLVVVGAAASVDELSAGPGGSATRRVPQGPARWRSSRQRCSSRRLRCSAWPAVELGPGGRRGAARQRRTAPWSAGPVARAAGAPPGSLRGLLERLPRPVSAPHRWRAAGSHPTRWARRTRSCRRSGSRVRRGGRRAALVVVGVGRRGADGRVGDRLQGGGGGPRRRPPRAADHEGAVPWVSRRRPWP